MKRVGRRNTNSIARFNILYTMYITSAVYFYLHDQTGDTYFYSPTVLQATLHTAIQVSIHIVYQDLCTYVDSPGGWK